MHPFLKDAQVPQTGVATLGRDLPRMATELLALLRLLLAMWPSTRGAPWEILLNRSTKPQRDRLQASGMPEFLWMAGIPLLS